MSPLKKSINAKGAEVREGREGELINKTDYARRTTFFITNLFNKYIIPFCS
jgi:hypothetical protein